MTETIEQNAADERLQQYLLGELSDHGQREVEERLMTDDEYFRSLLTAEDELIDTYVLDGLTPHQRVRFERHFLCTPERREGVRFAAAFRKFLTSNPVEAQTTSGAVPETRSRFRALLTWLNAQPRSPRLALSGVALVVVLGLSGLIFRVNQLQREVEQLRSPRAQSTTQEIEQQLAVERERAERLSRELQALDRESTPVLSGVPLGEQPGQPARGQVVSVSLPALRVRGAGNTPRVTIPPGTKSVELLLTLPGNDYQTCQAELTSEGKALKRWESVAVRRSRRDSSISLSVTANLLQPGGYVVRLSALGPTNELESIGAYYFTVVK